MTNKTFLSVEDVAEILVISKSYAYKIVQRLNADLKTKGFFDHIRSGEQAVFFRKDLLRSSRK